MPESLGDAIATEPAWLQAWVMVLVLTHLVSIAFIPGRKDGRWYARYEPMAIVTSFFAAAVMMNWLYEQAGYVRLLGLAHLVFWTPAWLWISDRIRTIGWQSVFGKYLVFYLVIAGLSLIVDAIDVVRYLVGDGELLNRYA